MYAERRSDCEAARVRFATITESPQSVAELLVHHTFTLHALTGELYREVIERTQQDRRWADSRESFFKANKRGEVWLLVLRRAAGLL